MLEMVVYCLAFVAACGIGTAMGVVIVEGLLRWRKKPVPPPAVEVEEVGFALKAPNETSVRREFQRAHDQALSLRRRVA